MDREVGLEAEEALVGSGETVQHGALVRRRAGVREAQRGRRRAVHIERRSWLARHFGDVWGKGVTYGTCACMYLLNMRPIFTGAAALRGVRALLQARGVAAEAVDLYGERVG